MKLYKFIFLFGYFVFVTVILFAQNQNEYNLSEETAVKLVTVDRLKSGVVHKSERVKYLVNEDVCDDKGNVLIKKGTPAYGTVLNSRGAGNWGRRGILDISVEYTTAVDGQRVNLTAVKGKKGRNRTGEVILTTALIGVPVALRKGANVTIASGTQIEAYVDEKLNIKIESQPAETEDVAVSKETENNLNIKGEIELKTEN